MCHLNNRDSAAIMATFKFFHGTILLIQVISSMNLIPNQSDLKSIHAEIYFETNPLPNLSILQSTFITLKIISIPGISYFRAQTFQRASSPAFKAIQLLLKISTKSIRPRRICFSQQRLFPWYSQIN